MTGFVSVRSIERKIHSEANVYEEQIEIIRDTIASKTVIGLEDMTSIVHRKGGFVSGEYWISFAIARANQGYMLAADIDTTYVI